MSKAKVDVMHCIACGKHFGSDELREEVYIDTLHIGDAHTYCWVVDDKGSSDTTGRVTVPQSKPGRNVRIVVQRT